MADRDGWVDAARAIGIVLVVYGHVARGVVNAGLDAPQPAFELVDNVVYSFHMPLFFFLSGLFFLPSFERRGLGGFCGSKMDTIFYPFLLWSLVQGAIEASLSKYTNGNVSYSDVLSLLWRPRAHFWFLYALFAILVASALLRRALPLADRAFAFTLLGLATLVYIAAVAFSQNTIVFDTALRFVYFALGAVFTQVIDARRLGSWAAVLGLGALFVAAQAAFHLGLGLKAYDEGPALLALASLSILFVVSLSVRLSRLPGTAIAFVGASSMGIYILHILAGSGARIVLQKGLGLQDVWVHMLVGCLVSLGAPLLAVVAIGRLKIPYVFAAPLSRAFSPARASATAR